MRRRALLQTLFFAAARSAITGAGLITSGIDADDVIPSLAAPVNAITESSGSSILFVLPHETIQLDSHIWIPYSDGLAVAVCKSGEDFQKVIDSTESLSGTVDDFYLEGVGENIASSVRFFYLSELKSIVNAYVAHDHLKAEQSKEFNIDLSDQVLCDAFTETLDEMLGFLGQIDEKISLYPEYRPKCLDDLIAYLADIQDHYSVSPIYGLTRDLSHKEKIGIITEWAFASANPNPSIKALNWFPIPTSLQGYFNESNDDDNVLLKSLSGILDDEYPVAKGQRFEHLRQQFVSHIKDYAAKFEAADEIDFEDVSQADTHSLPPLTGVPSVLRAAAGSVTMIETETSTPEQQHSALALEHNPAEPLDLTPATEKVIVPRNPPEP